MATRSASARAAGPTRAWSSAGTRAGVSSAAARLAYYAERFDVVEVDSPFYRLPRPRPPRSGPSGRRDGFVFHVKASGEMTGHREAERDEAFAAFREALAPLEQAGKLRGVLLQYPPRFVKSREALDELAAAAPLLEPLVPLVEFRHRSWLDEDEQADTLSFLERHGLAYVSVDSPRTRASNVLPRIAAATHAVAYVRFHGRNWKTWNMRGEDSARALRLDVRPGGARGVGRAARRSPARPTRCTRCSTTTATTTRPGARSPARAARRGGLHGDGRRRTRRPQAS